LPGQHPAAEERLSRLVQAIEHDIIPRLVRAHAHPGGAAPTPGTLPASEVQAFTQLVMARDDGAIERQLVLLRERGVSVETLFVDLLAPAARHLGALWEDDRCHFGDVTVGLGRLQQIMRSLSSAFGTAVHAPVGGRRALLMPAPGEQHTFGLSMVAEFFGRAGWEVVGLMDPAAGHYRDRVKDEWFDLVGLSAGSTTRLEAMAECIATVRQQSHNRAVALLVGGPLFLVHPELVERLGADGVVTDGRQAPMLAERLMGRRVMG
jgi:methanogenic corrinoid protein MtbC1